MGAEFRTQYLPTTIAAGLTAKTLAAIDGDFVAVSDPTRTMLLPTSSWHHTAGLGWDSGSFQVAFREHMVSADLGDDNTLAFTRGFAGLGITRAAINLVEYLGPAGGANEFIRRHKQTVTIAAAALTASTSSISGVGSFSKLLPIVFVSTDANSSDARHVAVEVDTVNTSGVYTVSLTRRGNSGAITATVYVYEMTGANWTVQKVPASISAANTKQDQTISSITAATSFVLRTFRESQTPSGPAYASPLVWVSAATTLSARSPAINTTTYIAFVVSNPSMSVQLLSAPDGTTDWAAGTGSAEQTQSLSFAAVDTSRAAIVGQAGSADTTAANHTSELWAFRLLSSTTGDARRGRSFGATEHVTQIVQFPQDLPTITGISATIRTGSSVVIDGTKLKPGGVAPTVKMDGASLTVTASSDTQITADVAIGTQIFGSKEFLVETTVGSASVAHDVLPPSGETYFNLFGTSASTGGLTAIPAFAETSQVWAKLLKDSAVVTKDVTSTDNFQILPSRLVELDDGISVPATVQLSANNNNGSGWSSFQTITIDTSIAKPVVSTIPPLALSVGTGVQFDLALYATGESTVTILTGTLPAGLSMTGSTGFITGTPTTAGVSTITVRYTNEAGSEDSAAFALTAYTVPVVRTIPPIHYGVGQALTLDLSDYATDFNSVQIVGALPPGLEFAAGVISGTPTVAGVFALVAQFSNTGPTPANSNVFRVVEGVERIRQMTTSQASPRRRRFFQ